MKKSLLFGFFLNLFFNFLYGQGQPVILPNGQLSSQVYTEDILALPFPKSDYGQIIGLSSAQTREAMTNKAKGNVLGSPYLFENWHNPSKIFFKDKVYDVNTFNYNIYAKRFEAKLSQDSVFIINSWNVKKVIINDRVFSQYLDPESQKVSYFEELVDFDNYRVLGKHYINIKSGSVNPLTKEKLTEDEFIRKEAFYLCDLNNNLLNEINLKKSNVQPLFKKEKLDNVNKFVKANHFKFSNIDDVIKIVQYYNTL